MKKFRVKETRTDDIIFTISDNQQLFGYHQWYDVRRRHNESWKTMHERSSNEYLMTPYRESVHVTELAAVTDIDSSYFTDLVHRPIRRKYSKQRYMDEIEKVLRIGNRIGYQKNECLRINREFSEEQTWLDAIEHQYRYYNDAFEEYLSDDHGLSMKILNKAYEDVKRNNELIVKRDVLLDEFSQVRLEVYQSEEMWRIAKMCQEFLCKITSSSPQSSENGSIQQAKSSEKNSQRTSIIGTLECLSGAFEKDISDNYDTSERITLQDPQELPQFFSAIEQRNLDALIHLESLAGPIAEMTTNCVRAEELIGGEIKLIEESLKELESLINVNEQRLMKLESYSAYLLNEVFQKLVCSESVLHLRVFTESTYESCVGPNDANLDCSAMMQVIEKTYESLNKSLDNLPYNIVNICEKGGFATGMRIMREAGDASEKFDLMHRLLLALERITDPPHLIPALKSQPESLEHSTKP